MEETDDSLDDWRELMTTSSGLFSGITIMSNPEPNLEDDEIRVGSVVLIENTAADFSDAASPLVSSPRCLTIPSGISPHELLGSPVMLPNSQMSPTTGTLGSTPPPGVPLSDKLQDGGDDVSSFGHSDPVSFPCYPPSHNQVYSGENLTSEDDCQSLVCMQSPTNFEFVGEEEKVRAKSYGMKGECGGFQLSSHSYGVADKEMREAKIVNGGGGGESVDGMKKGVHPNPTKTSEDGYNWRKYGQKQVKGSEYPRSYFKCTHPSCLVKKKVERSHHGEITEIIYKGDHNHGTPQPTRRSTFGSAPEPVWKELQQQQQQQEQVVVVVGGSEWKSSTPQVCDNQKTVSSVETPELCSHEEEEEEDTTTTQGSLSVGEDDDAESESKRRKKESCLIETALGSRALREPRVIVQIESEVDIIDDGYRWRKYGQKVVKGNPNPRSYYKCTSGGCTVRKHVERASHNLKYVLTTYEGKHNHVVPAARNGNGNGNMNGNGNGNGNGARNCHLPKAEGQELDRKMEYSSDFLRSNYGGLMKLPTVGSYNYIPSLSMSFPLTLSFPSTFGMPAYNTQPPLPSFFVDHHIKGMLTPKQERRN